MFRHWYRCDTGHQHNQWRSEGPEPINTPCTLCGLLQPPWASEDMTTAKFKSDNGIVDSPQLDLFK
jgi:hypothetical protein